MKPLVPELTDFTFGIYETTMGFRVIIRDSYS